MEEKRVKAVRKKGTQTKNAVRDGASHPDSDYFCDYRPRYEEPYNVYEKAKQHIKNLKKMKKDVDNGK